jgi:hypothetical protein
MQIGSDRRQRRQIHVDRERTDRRQKPEHDGVTGERRGHEIFFFCSVRAVLGVRSRRLERLRPVFRQLRVISRNSSMDPGQTLWSAMSENVDRPALITFRLGLLG